MPTLVKLRSLFLPVSIGLLIVVAAGWYNLVWLPSEHKYLDDRNFRLLSTLSEEISTSINNYDKMLDNASDSGINEKMLESYLLKVAPQLKPLEESDVREVIGSDYGDPPKIAVRADEGTHFLYLAFQRRPEAPKYAVRTDLDKLIRKLLPPDNRSPFDVVLVLEANGTVIFKKSSPGFDVTRIDALMDESGTARTGKPEPIDVKSLTQSSRFLEITLANAHYRLYSQPLQLSLPAIRPERKGAKDKGNSAEPKDWVMCGLAKAEAFRSESESISYTYILWFSAAILLAVAAYPFLKLHVSSPAERLRAIEVAVTAVFACAAAATMTFILLDLYHWRKDFEEQANQQMRDLTGAIDRNFGEEQKAAFEQLDEFSKDGRLATALREAQVPSRQRPQFKGDEGACEPESACRTQILASDDSAKNLLRYPYLQFASWSDSNGDQRVKWTIRGRITPFINLDDGSIPYYPAIKRGIEDPGGFHPAPTKGIGSQYSPNTGDNITIFWKLLDGDGKQVSGKMDAKERKSVFSASVVTHPISVTGPILPADFQFAIVNGDGMVIFHSDSTRNLRENFFAETDQNQEIRSRLLMRAEGALTANYMGRGHRLYIRPMGANPDELWSVIVFRDLRLEQTMNLEVLSLATILFLFYALVMALAVGFLLGAQRRGAVGSWLWPDSRKAVTYWRLAIINGIAILLLLVLSEYPMQPAPLFCAVFIPMGALILNLVALKRGADHSSSVDVGEERMPSRWQVGYAGTCATLLAVVAVLPCLSFFKVAWDFEQKLFIERSQLRLIEDVNARRQIVRSDYQGVQLGRYAELLLAEPETQKEPMFSYHQSFLGTETYPVGEYKKQDPVQCGLGRARYPERCVESFLGTFSPLYNELAADSRYLAEASSDIWKWSSSSSGGKEYLELQRQQGENEARSVTSSLTPLHAPWGNWQWWVGSMAYLAILFWLVRFSLRRVFLLDIVEPAGADHPDAPLDPTSLIINFPVNLLVIGRSSCSTIAGLLERKEVQAYDLYELLNVPMRRAASPGGGSSEVNVSYDPVEDIVRDGRPVVFYNFERGLEEPESNQQKLSTLERVLCRLHQSVVITSKVDPLAKSTEDEREQWRSVLQSFVRIDLNSCPTQRSDETEELFQRRISADAYYNWLLSDRPQAQKLALVQMSQEKVVNPNSRGVIHELMKAGLVVRRWGMLTIKDDRFSHFLKNAIPRKSIKHWERHGAGMHSATLRTSLLVVGAGIAGFLLYTQGAIFNTWITYMTGLAAAVPAILRMIEILSRGGGEAQLH
jgi:hypothetical protein